MQISKATIEEFKKLYRAKEGKIISDERALEIVTNLLLVFDAVYHPIPDEQSSYQKPMKTNGETEMRYLTEDVVSSLMFFLSGASVV